MINHGDRPHRIMLYGVTGSGKSTLAAAIAGRLDLPMVFIDDLTWLPGWDPVPDDEQRVIIERICGQDCWVIDHGYGSWIDIPLARVNLIIGLDYPRLLSLSRLIRRSITNLASGRPICNGNTESLRHLFQQESIVLWHFRSFARKRARMRGWAVDPTAPPVLLFDRPSQVAKWLGTLPRRD
jgi:adenylate kinase family enzyme